MNEPTDIDEARDMLKKRYPGRTLSVEYAVWHAMDGHDYPSYSIAIFSPCGLCLAHHVISARTLSEAWRKLPRDACGSTGVVRSDEDVYGTYAGHGTRSHAKACTECWRGAGEGDPEARIADRG